MNKLNSKTNIDMKFNFRLPLSFKFFPIFSSMKRYSAYHNFKQKLFNSIVNLHKSEKTKMDYLFAHFVTAQVSFDETQSFHLMVIFSILSLDSL